MHLLQAGVNLVYIRDILGHISIQTTEIYARADSKQKREALESAYVNMIPNDITECSWEKDQELKIWLKISPSRSFAYLLKSIYVVKNVIYTYWFDKII